VRLDYFPSLFRLLYRATLLLARLHFSGFFPPLWPQFGGRRGVFFPITFFLPSLTFSYPEKRLISTCCNLFGCSLISTLACVPITLVRAFAAQTSRETYYFFPPACPRISDPFTLGDRRMNRPERAPFCNPLPFVGSQNNSSLVLPSSFSVKGALARWVSVLSES